MKLFFKLVRIILTPIVLFVDWITTPKGIDRPAAEQAEVDAQTSTMALYHFRTCPFCIKTRHAMKRLSLNIETRDAQHDPKAREELERGGGQVKVPCLRMVDDQGKETWMYESADIIAYLQERFSPASAAGAAKVTDA